MSVTCAVYQLSVVLWCEGEESIILCPQINNRCLWKSLVMKKNCEYDSDRALSTFKKSSQLLLFKHASFQCSCTLLKSTAVISSSYSHPSLDVCSCMWHGTREGLVCILASLLVNGDHAPKTSAMPNIFQYSETERKEVDVNKVEFRARKDWLENKF